MSTNNHLFEINNLSIETVSRKNRKKLIEDFSIQLSSGEVVGVVGETGAGKSLSMMASVGLLSLGVKATQGNVKFNGQISQIIKSKELRNHLGNGIALLFQNARGALNPFMRINSQIDRVLRIKGVPNSDRKKEIHNLMRSVGLDAISLGQQYAHQISGGQAQRVALACVLATNPQVLICDEPTTALDVTTEREVLTLFKRLCTEKQMGLILITHNLALVSQYCDRVILMHAGHIVESGDVKTFFSNPLHPYTQGLLKAIPDVDQPHNLIPLKGSVWGGGDFENRCRFAHRCQYLRDECLVETPEIRFHDGHSVRCVLY